MLYLYFPFVSTFSYYCFLLSCMHLLVCFWWTLIFQHQSLRRLTSHCSKKLRKTIRREFEFLIFVFWHFVLLWCLDAKIVSAFVSVLLCFKSCMLTKTIVDVYLLCEMKLPVVCFVCVRENLTLLLHRKVFTGEISLFVSSAGHRYVHIFRILGSGVWHPF